MPAELIMAFGVLVVSAALIWSGFKGVPGIGILVGLAVTAATVVWLEPTGFASIGFSAPTSWGQAVLVGVIAGVALQLLSVVLVEPLTERLTGETHDHSIVESVRGSTAKLAQWLLIAWVMAALLEETLYRGYLISEIREALGSTSGVAILAVVGSSVVFGLSHWYQGKAGVLSTGIIGVFLGVIFVTQNYNLWAPIIAHGVIDTVGILLIAYGGDRVLRRAAGWNDSYAEAPE